LYEPAGQYAAVLWRFAACHVPAEYQSGILPDSFCEKSAAGIIF